MLRTRQASLGAGGVGALQVLHLRRADGPGQAHLDITWLRDETLEDLDNLPAPEIIAREIVEDLTAALVEFEAVAAALELGAGVE